MVAGKFGVTRDCMEPLVKGGSGRDVLPKVWMNSLVSIAFFVTRVMAVLVSRKSMFKVMQPLVTRVIQALY